MESCLHVFLQRASQVVNYYAVFPPKFPKQFLCLFVCSPLSIQASSLPLCQRVFLGGTAMAPPQWFTVLPSEPPAEVPLPLSPLTGPVHQLEWRCLEGDAVADFIVVGLLQWLIDLRSCFWERWFYMILPFKTTKAY